MHHNDVHALSVCRILSHLDDDQTELTLQQEKEAFADTIRCVSCLGQMHPKAKSISISLWTRSVYEGVCVCVNIPAL